MKLYVKKHKINLVTTSFSLSDVLNDLHRLRNKASHGVMISKEEYEVILKYKNEGLFNGLSALKLVFEGNEIHPTIDEIDKYLWNY